MEDRAARPTRDPMGFKVVARRTHGRLSADTAFGAEVSLSRCRDAPSSSGPIVGIEHRRDPAAHHELPVLYRPGITIPDRLRVPVTLVSFLPQIVDRDLEVAEWNVLSSRHRFDAIGVRSLANRQILERGHQFFGRCRHGLTLLIG